MQRTVQLKLTRREKECFKIVLSTPLFYNNTLLIDSKNPSLGGITNGTIIISAVCLNPNSLAQLYCLAKG